MEIGPVGRYFVGSMYKGLNGIVFVFLGAFTIGVEVDAGIDGLHVHRSVKGTEGKV